jgi:hypothetical protein
MNKPIQFMALMFGAAAVSMPTLAMAQTVGVTVISPAPLLAKGAGVDVSTQITCTGISNATVQFVVSLTERVGSKVSFGTGNTIASPPITCDNSPLLIELIVTSLTGRFAKGEAIAQAIATVCGESSPGFLYAGLDSKRH